MSSSYNKLPTSSETMGADPQPWRGTAWVLTPCRIHARGPPVQVKLGQEADSVSMTSSAQLPRLVNTTGTT